MQTSPHMYYNGVSESSAQTPLPTQPHSQSSHVLLSFILAERGTDRPVFTTPNDAKLLFGNKTFLKNVPWNVHQNDYLTHALERDTHAIVKRIILPDAKKARIRISLETSFTLIPIYKYHEDWTLAKTYNSFSGQWDNIVLGQRKGLKVTPRVSIVSNDGIGSFGQGNKVSEESSQTYPIFDLELREFGDFGNDLAFTLMNIKRDLTDVIDPLEFIARTGISFSEGIGYPILNKQGEEVTAFTLVGDMIDPLTTAKQHLSSAVNNFNNLIGRTHVYQNNIEEILSQLIHGSNTDPTYLGEKALIEEAILLNTDVDLTYPHAVDIDVDLNRYYFDILTGKNNKGNFFINGDYPSLEQLGEIEFTEGETVNFIGGSDGFPLDVNGEVDRLKLLQYYDEAVRVELNKFSNAGHMYQNLSKFPYTVWYDSGYSMPTKIAAFNINRYRPEVTLLLAAYSYADYSESGLTISCEGAVSGTGCIEFSGTWNIEIDDEEVATNLNAEQIKDYLNGTGEFNVFECVDEVPVEPEPDPTPIGCEGAIDTLNVSGQGAELTLKISINDVYVGRIDGGLNIQMLNDILQSHGLSYTDGLGFKNDTDQYVRLKLEAGQFDEFTQQPTAYSNFWTVVDLNNPTVLVKQRNSDDVLNIADVTPDIYNEFTHSPLYAVLTACLAPAM